MKAAGRRGAEGAAVRQLAQVREAPESSRKFVVPFLEYLDRIGFTRRVGDKRVLHEAATVPR